MEPNRTDLTKEEILDQEAAEACLTPTQRQLILSAMESYHSQKKNDLAVFANKKMEKAFDSGVFWRACYCPPEDQSEFDYEQKVRHSRNNWMNENGINAELIDSEQKEKPLLERIEKLTKTLNTCEKTFELISEIVFNLKASADGDNLKEMVEAVDIDFPLIQAKIKDTLLNTKS